MTYHHRPQKIVLAYSGGLDTSVILRWLKDTTRAEVVACFVDLGQGDNVRQVKEKALRTGASPKFRVCPPNRRWSIRPSGVRLKGSPRFSRS